MLIRAARRVSWKGVLLGDPNRRHTDLSSWARFSKSYPVTCRAPASGSQGRGEAGARRLLSSSGALCPALIFCSAWCPRAQGLCGSSSPGTKFLNKEVTRWLSFLNQYSPCTLWTISPQICTVCDDGFSPLRCPGDPARPVQCEPSFRDLRKQPRKSSSVGFHSFPHLWLRKAAERLSCLVTRERAFATL